MGMDHIYSRQSPGVAQVVAGFLGLGGRRLGRDGELEARRRDVLNGDAGAETDSRCEVC